MSGVRRNIPIADAHIEIVFSGEDIFVPKVHMKQGSYDFFNIFAAVC